MEIPSSVLERLPSPCLVVDVAAADRNIARAVALADDGGVRLRPHFKAHKCTTLMRRQLAAGRCAGVTAQTSWEALALVRAGVDDILIAGPVVDATSIAEVVETTAAASVTVVVDDLVHVDHLEVAARDAAVTIGVLIELDVGSGRCGVPYGDARLLELARAIAASGHLRFGGFQAYEGFAVLREDPAVRDTLVRQVADHVESERRRLEADGHRVDVVSGAGTGSAVESVRHRVHDELQLGSYVLMDAAYDAVGVPFELAVACVTRCVSRRDPAAAVLNAGLKALAIDHGLPRPATPGLRALALSDEHMRLAVAAGVSLEVGDIVLVEPSHLDPTVNLHDTLFAWDAASGRIDAWPVDGRNRSSERYRG